MSIFKISKLYIYLFLFFVSLIIYSNSLNGDFLFDDKTLIVNNDFIKHIKNIPLFFVTEEYMYQNNFEKAYNYYRPLQILSFAINYRIWRLNPFGYHLTNIIIHSLNAFLIFYLIYRLFSNFGLALLSSILFCVHPLHTEAVSSISGGAELLVSLFTLLTLIFYIRYLDFRKGLAFILSIFSFVFALLSKEAGFLIFVPLAILFLGLKSKISKDSLLLHFFIFTGILVSYVILRLKILVPIKMLPAGSPSIFLDILNLSRILIEYVNLLILPRNLHILRSIAPVVSYRITYIILPIFLLILVTVISAVSIRQKKYVLLFGTAWFILSLLHLVRSMYKFNIDITMEEHWAYFASAGFFVILAYLILSTKKFKIITAAFVIIAYSFLTVINSRHWKEELSFYRYNLRFVRPQISLIPHYNLGKALYERGLYKQAIDEVNIALKIDPNLFNTYILLGDILKKMKRFSEAEQAYKNALKIDYFCWQANRKLKLLAEETGRPYQEEVDPALSPMEAKIVSHIRMAEFYEAIKIIYHELSVSPTPRLYALAGITFAKVGEYRAALKAFDTALKLAPQDKMALHNLSVLYYNMNQLEKAYEIRKKIEQIK